MRGAWPTRSRTCWHRIRTSGCWSGSDRCARRSPARPSASPRRYARLSTTWRPHPAQAAGRRLRRHAPSTRGAAAAYTHLPHPRRHRRRGMALLDFQRAYRSAGMEPTGEELADHLAVVLELSAQTDPGRGRQPARDPPGWSCSGPPCAKPARTTPARSRPSGASRRISASWPTRNWVRTNQRVTGHAHRSRRGLHSIGPPADSTSTRRPRRRRACDQLSKHGDDADSRAPARE